LLFLALRDCGNVISVARFKNGQVHFTCNYRAVVNGERKVLWVKLCDKNRNTGHGSKSATAVVQLAEDHMRGINGNDGGAPTADMTVQEFWQQTYLPFITSNKKPSTVDGYTQVWEKHLKPHFSDQTLRDYRTPMMTNFLTSLTKTLRPRTLKH